jgi:hypothetical protein
VSNPNLDLCPQWQGGPIIPPGRSSLFVVFYDSQGYGGGIPFQVIRRKCIYPTPFLLFIYIHYHSLRSLGGSVFVPSPFCFLPLFFPTRDSESPGARVGVFPGVNSLHASWFVCLSERFPLVVVLGEMRAKIVTSFPLWNKGLFLSFVLQKINIPKNGDSSRLPRLDHDDFGSMTLSSPFPLFCHKRISSPDRGGVRSAVRI